MKTKEVDNYRQVSLGCWSATRRICLMGNALEPSSVRRHTNETFTKGEMTKRELVIETVLFRSHFTHSARHFSSEVASSHYIHAVQPIIGDTIIRSYRSVTIPRWIPHVSSMSQISMLVFIISSFHSPSLSMSQSHLQPLVRAISFQSGCIYQPLE